LQPVENDPAQEAARNNTIEWISGFVGMHNDPSEPLTVIYYPIVSDALSNVDVEGKQDSKVLGLLAL
jgi:hypothetical protein